MKKNKIIIILILIIIIAGLFFAVRYIDNNNNNNDNINDNFSNTQWTVAEELTVVPTMNDKLNADTAWCGTFQLIWNDLKNELVKQDIVFNPQIEVVENLNKEDFNTNMISEDYYYKKYGVMSKSLKVEIEKEIEDKFNETSDVLGDFDWEDTPEGTYFLYAILKREFEFINEFDKLENAYFANKYENINYFGIDSNTDKKVREQVEVLYYNSDDDFAIILNTKQDDEVILCRTSEGNTFNEIYDNINLLDKMYSGNKNLSNIDTVKVPNMNFNVKKEFTELQNKLFKFANDEEYFIYKALQTINFELNQKGGKIKSEAAMEVRKNSAIITDDVKERHFNLDDTFTIFLREKGKEKPYFAARIENITKFQ